MTDPIKHLTKVSGRGFFSHNTEPERGREEGVEEEREICTICKSSPSHYYRLVKMYINTLNIWTTYDKFNSVSNINNKELTRLTRLTRMPTAEKAVKERDCTQMPVAKKERTDHKCLWQKRKKDQTTNAGGKRKMAALIRQANS